MPTTQTCPWVIFPIDYDVQSEVETPSRGYRSNVLVQAEDGSRYQLFFIDPTRLQQMLADDVRAGRPYYSEPGLIILPEVTTESVAQAIQGLWQDGYFDHLKPL